MCGRAPLCDAFINVAIYRPRGKRAITAELEREIKRKVEVYSILFSSRTRRELTSCRNKT